MLLDHSRGTTVHYEIQPATIYLQEALWLLGGFFAVTVLVAAVCRGRRYRISTRAIFAYLLVCSLVFWGANRFWFHARDSVTWGTTGLFYVDDLKSRIGRQAFEEHLALTCSREFKLECGRHIAPRAQLEALHDRNSQWLQRVDDDGSDPFIRDVSVEVRLSDLTPYEQEVLKAWVDAWIHESQHLALVRWPVGPISPSVSAEDPAWTTFQGGDVTRTSFDCPPRTRHVRRAMSAFIREHPETPRAAYFRRVLVAARELDARTGLVVDIEDEYGAATDR